MTRHARDLFRNLLQPKLSDSPAGAGVEEPADDEDGGDGSFGAFGGAPQGVICLDYGARDDRRS